MRELSFQHFGGGELGRSSRLSSRSLKQKTADVEKLVSTGLLDITKTKTELAVHPQLEEEHGHLLEPSSSTSFESLTGCWEAAQQTSNPLCPGRSETCVEQQLSEQQSVPQPEDPDMNELVPQLAIIASPAETLPASTIKIAQNV